MKSLPEKIASTTRKGVEGVGKAFVKAALYSAFVMTVLSACQKDDEVTPNTPPEAGCTPAGEVCFKPVPGTVIATCDDVSDVDQDIIAYSLREDLNSSHFTARHNGNGGYELLTSETTTVQDLQNLPDQFDLVVILDDGNGGRRSVTYSLNKNEQLCGNPPTLGNTGENHGPFSELTEAGTHITSIQVLDENNNEITGDSYSMKKGGNKFEVDASGNITAKGNLNFEQRRFEDIEVEIQIGVFKLIWTGQVGVTNEGPDGFLQVGVFNLGPNSGFPKSGNDFSRIMELHDDGNPTGVRDTIANRTNESFSELRENVDNSPFVANGLMLMEVMKENGLGVPGLSWIYEDPVESENRLYALKVDATGERLKTEDLGKEIKNIESNLNEEGYFVTDINTWANWPASPEGEKFRGALTNLAQNIADGKFNSNRAAISQASVDLELL